MLNSGVFSALIHLSISAIFSLVNPIRRTTNMTKINIGRIIIAIGLVLLLSTLVFSADLNLRYPGYVWTKYDYSLTNENSQQRDGRLMFNIQQGVESRDWPHITLYTGLNLYKPFRHEDDNYLSLGIKNHTLFPGVEFGLERHFVTTLTPDLDNRTVGYISLYKQWSIEKK